MGNFRYAKYDASSAANAIDDPNKVAGDDPVGFTAAQASSLFAANNIATAAVSGYTTGWLPGNAFAVRFGFKPTGVSGTASITIEGSLDGRTSATTLGTVGITSADNGIQWYTPPVIVGYPYFRINVVADGGGTHSIGIGV